MQLSWVAVATLNRLRVRLVAVVIRVPGYRRARAARSPNGDDLARSRVPDRTGESGSKPLADRGQVDERLTLDVGLVGLRERLQRGPEPRGEQVAADCCHLGPHGDAAARVPLTVEGTLLDDIASCVLNRARRRPAPNTITS